MTVSLKKYSHEEIEKMSMVDIANLVLLEEQKPLTFKETFDKVSQLKNWDETQKQNKISQFYTDLNVDGRFITNGSNTWGLKRWYRVDQMSAEFATAEMEDVSEDEELNLELDDLDEFEESDEYGEFEEDDDLDADFVAEDDV